MDPADWDRRYALGPVWTAAPNVWVAGALASLPPGKALDLAAGEGRHALWLAGRGWQVTAVAFSREALARGRDRERAMEPAPPTPITWVRADLTTHRPTVRAYDAVVLAYLHLPAQQRCRVVLTAAAALAPGGTLVVVGHDRTNATAGVGGPADPLVLFSPEDVVADLAGAQGVTVVSAARRQRDVPGAARQAIDAVVVARRVE